MMTNRNIIIGLVALLLIALIGAVYFYSKANANPQKQAAAQLKATVAAVGKLIVLPDETPTLATVSDPSKLKDQAFFAKAKKGDQVLIYAQAKEAILYDPSINKIIEVAPINVGGTP